MASTTTKTADRPKRQRFSPAERERLIVDGAIQFFAKVGFAGQTRELAQRLGISQPLLYRYFPTKKDLIERVYDEVFMGRWKSEWEDIIVDRAAPLRDRLVGFYDAYASEVLTYEWIRIYMFAGLADEDINRRYIDLLEQRLLIPVCTEIRAAAGVVDPEAASISDLEIEAAWNIHAAIFYYFVRKFIYRTPVEPDLAAYIRDTVDRTLEGAFVVIRKADNTNSPKAKN
ncbi:MAG: TetR family transcriptional regulator [Alphaproteobacteria bacterium]|nr:TetR family transcriptional regulator [Alphaproteobacteria bacterium]HCP00556.1 TetR family transcriptional regulator [Rhodospirillaceae bacterium]